MNHTTQPIPVFRDYTVITEPMANQIRSSGRLEWMTRGIFAIGSTFHIDLGGEKIYFKVIDSEYFDEGLVYYLSEKVDTTCDDGGKSNV